MVAQELLSLGLVVVQRARDLERCVLSLQEHSAEDIEEIAEDALVKTSCDKEQPARIRERKVPGKACNVPPNAVSAQCRACCSEVFRRPESSAVLDADGTEHSITCSMRHIVRRNANCAVTATE